MKNPRDIIIRPLITEKSMDDSEFNRYTFEVAKNANKIEIKNAVEEIFDVKVEKVATMNMNSKMKKEWAVSKAEEKTGKKPSLN